MTRRCEASAQPALIDKASLPALWDGTGWPFVGTSRATSHPAANASQVTGAHERPAPPRPTRP